MTSCGSAERDGRFGEACKVFCHGALPLVPNAGARCGVTAAWPDSISVFVYRCPAGEHGLSQDVQGGQAPEAVPEGCGVWPATKVTPGKEEESD